MPRTGNYEPIASTPAQIEATNRRMFEFGRLALGDTLISASSLGILPQLAEDPIIKSLSEKYADGYPADNEVSS